MNNGYGYNRLPTIGYIRSATGDRLHYSAKEAELLTMVQALAEKVVELEQTVESLRILAIVSAKGS